MQKRMTIEPVLRMAGNPGITLDQKDIYISADFPGSDRVTLILYRKGTDTILSEEELPPSAFDGCRRTVHISGIKVQDLEYNFRVDGEVKQDPRAVLIRGRKHFGDLSERTEHQLRCGMLSGSFDWGEDARPAHAWEDVISYGLHVRGFTKDPRSGVRHKGTFLGLEEKIPYLKELGINQIILMPAYEFEDAVPVRTSGPGMYAPGADSRDAALMPERKCNYWGFSESFYFAPKMSFSDSGKPDLEMKSMVRAMHAEGIEVIMEMAFPDGLDAAFMTDCLCWWAYEYHIDGFMLLTCSENAHMLARIPELSRVKLLTGYFDENKIGLGRKSTDPSWRGSAALPPRRLADCHDGFRTDARKLLKGDENQLAAFVERVRANHDRKAVLNRITGHDGFTLMDLVSYDKKHNEENGEENRDGSESEFSWNCGVEGPTRKKAIVSLRHRQIRNALAMLLLSQGTPMLLAGDEFGNSQKGNNNPWCIDSPVTWVNWGAMKSGEDLLKFTKELIALRKRHPILHPDHYLEGTDRTSCGFPDFSCHSDRAWFGNFEYQSRQTGILYCGRNDGADDFVYVGYNFHWEEQTLALPYLPDGMHWEKELCTARDETSDEQQEKEEHCRVLTLPGRSICVLKGVR